MTHFIIVHGITGMVNLPKIKTDQQRQIVKAYNNGMSDTIFSILIANQNILADLLWQAMYYKTRQRYLELTTFSADVMSENLKLFDNYLRNKDNISSIKIPRYQENCGFEDWCLRF